ncbi:MAG TPA: 30S ribosomal protein S16, partial [Candidatus Saccharimonadia bacterium]|nr:30S ribosomal protein S16 [Candidatus Saccharimonadia bacterium]
MVKLKLARIGRAHQPHYRIVAVEENTKASGKYIENIGYYIPTDEPKTLKIDKALYDAWIKKGAIPTDTVARLAQGPLAAKKKAKRNKHHEEAMAKKAAAVPAPATAPAPVAEAPKAEAAVTESAPAEKPA